MTDSLPPSNIQKEKKAYIYCICSPNEYFYIGSTTNELKCRLYEHKQLAKKYPERKIYAHFNSIEWKNVVITELEEFTFINRNDMLEKEKQYIKEQITNPLCLNNNECILTKEELKYKQKKYREENKGKIKEYHTAYNKGNSEKRCEYSKRWKEENTEKARETQKEYYEKNKEIISEKNKAYVESHKQETAEYKKQWALEKKEQLAQLSKKRREANKEYIQEKGKQYYEENKEKCQERIKAYREKNRDAILAKESEKRANIKEEEPVSCDCGGSYRSWGKWKHERTKRHVQHVESS